MVPQLTLDWEGPYRFGESDFRQVPNAPAVYLWTLEAAGRNLVVYVGETKTLLARWSDHFWWQLGGQYRVFDPISLRQGKLVGIYGYKSPGQHLTDFTEDVALAAYQNARLYQLWYALLPPEEFASRSSRLGIESAIHNQLKQGEHLITNGKLSVSSANTRKVCCVNRWKNGVVVEGMAPEVVISYGDLE